MIVVRRLDFDDKPKVEAAMRLAAMMHSESPLHSPYPFDTMQVHELMRAACKDPDWLPLVCLRDDEVIGMGLLMCQPMFFGPDKEVSDLAFYVRPDCRGTSAAFRMMAFIDLWASALGAVRIQVGIHTGINHDVALSFFQKIGYRVSGICVEKSVN